MMLAQDDVKLEIQGVYGVYDVIVKLSSDDSEKLKSIVTNDIRKIENVQSTLTMLVIEQQENHNFFNSSTSCKISSFVLKTCGEILRTGFS